MFDQLTDSQKMMIDQLAAGHIQLRDVLRVATKTLQNSIITDGISTRQQILSMCQSFQRDFAKQDRSLSRRLNHQTDAVRTDLALVQVSLQHSTNEVVRRIQSSENATQLQLRDLAKSVKGIQSLLAGATSMSKSASPTGKAKPTFFTLKNGKKYNPPKIVGDNTFLISVFSSKPPKRQEAFVPGFGEGSLWTVRLGNARHEIEWPLSEHNRYRCSPEAHDRSLLHWLEYGSGVFWLVGTPATGNSALLQMIFHSAATEEALQRWSGCRKLLKVFFRPIVISAVDTIIELFKTLAYHILSAYPDKLDPILKILEIEDELSQIWSEQLLWNTLQILFASLDGKFCLALFLDGATNLADRGVLHDKLFRLPHLKFIISTRPQHSLSWRETSSGESLHLRDLLSAHDVEALLRKRLESIKFSSISFTVTEKLVRAASVAVVSLAGGSILMADLINQGLVKRVQSGMSLSDVVNGPDSAWRAIVTEAYDNLLNQVPELQQAELLRVVDILSKVPYGLKVFHLALRHKMCIVREFEDCVTSREYARMMSDQLYQIQDLCSKSVAYIVELCVCFLDVVDPLKQYVTVLDMGQVGFSHDTAKDYLLDRYSTRISTSNRGIAKPLTTSILAAWVVVMYESRYRLSDTAQGQQHILRYIDDVLDLLRSLCQIGELDKSEHAKTLARMTDMLSHERQLHGVHQDDTTKAVSERFAQASEVISQVSAKDT